MRGKIVCNMVEKMGEIRLKGMFSVKMSDYKEDWKEKAINRVSRQ